MKKIMLMGLVAVMGAATVLATTLAEARGNIDKAISDPNVMGELTKGLSAEDQKQFLSDVNKAIGDMPASAEEKAAKYLNANKAAVKAASKENKTAMLAEVFATVPPEALTVINERFASDLFNRAADPKVTYTDEQYTAIALEAMQKINERTAETENPSVRSTFAILMFVRASNGTPADLVDKLVATLKDPDAQQLAKDDWIPPALGKDNETPDYEPLLGAADAGRRPDFKQVFIIAGPQYLDALLADLNGKQTDPKRFSQTSTPILDAVQSPLIYQIPTLQEGVDGSDIPVAPDGKPYPWQNKR